MVEAVRAANVHFQVGFNKRFYTGYRQARLLLQKGELATPTGIDARFWFQAGRRDGLLHNGVHFLDLVQYFLGPVKNVFARRCAPPVEGPAADTVAVSLGFESGAVGNILLSSLASWDYPNEHVDIVGSNGTALSVENGRALRVFRKGDGRPSELYENWLYDIETDTGESLTIAGTAGLNARLTEEKVGLLVRLTFLGWGQTKKGARFKQIDVEIDVPDDENESADVAPF